MEHSLEQGIRRGIPVGGVGGRACVCVWVGRCACVWGVVGVWCMVRGPQCTHGLCTTDTLTRGELAGAVSLPACDGTRSHTAVSPHAYRQTSV